MLLVSISMGYIASCNNEWLSTGINHIMADMTSIHAEQDAIQKLKTNKGRNIKIDLTVIRYNNKNELCESKPCINCLSSMYIDCIRKGYLIKNVYYSTSEGIVVKNKLSRLINTPVQHFTDFFKLTNDNKKKICKLESLFGINYVLFD
jgi:deoxycytidylate deaminase